MSAPRSSDRSFHMIEAIAVPERLEGAPVSASPAVVGRDQKNRRLRNLFCLGRTFRRLRVALGLNRRSYLLGARRYAKAVSG